MAHKHPKTFAMASIALGCALGVAHAPDSPPPPIDPSQLRTLLKLKPGEHLPALGGGRPTARPPLPIGWNFEICFQSQLFTDGSNFFVIAFNRDGTFFFGAGGVQTSIQAQLLAA